MFVNQIVEDIVERAELVALQRSLEHKGHNVRRATFGTRYSLGINDANDLEIQRLLQKHGLYKDVAKSITEFDVEESSYHQIISNLDDCEPVSVMSKPDIPALNFGRLQINQLTPKTKKGHRHSKSFIAKPTCYIPAKPKYR